MPVQMTLDWQTLELPIVGGLDEKADSVLTTRPTQLVNCLERKTGALSKRFGYTLLTQANLRLDGSTPSAPDGLYAYGDELLRVGSGELDSYQAIGSSDWVRRGTVPEAAVSRGPMGSVATAYTSSSKLQEPTVMVSNGYLLTGYTAYGTFATLGITGYQVVLEVVRESTGERVAAITVASASTQLGSVRVVAIGSTIVVFWYDYSATAIKAQAVSLTTMAVSGSPATIASSNSARFDVASDGSTSAGIVYTSTTPDVMFLKVSAALATSGGLTILASFTATAVSVDWTANHFWIAIAYRTGGNRLLRVAALSTAFAADASITTISTLASSNDVRAIGITQLDTNRAIVAWTDDHLGSYWNEVTYSAGPTLAAAYSDRQLRQHYLLSKPLVLSTRRAYALVHNVHNTHGSNFLVDLAAQNGSFTAPARIVGVALPRQAMRTVVGSTGAPDEWQYRPRFTNVSGWATGSSSYYVASTITDGASPTTVGVNQQPVALKWAFDSQWKRTTCVANGLMVVSGGVVTAYDGGSAFELGFAYEPDFKPDSTSYGLTASAAGGQMTASATYGYVQVYAWRDAKGNVHASAPSAVSSVTLGSSDNQVLGYVFPLHLTNKRDVQIWLYRTTANGSTFYLHSIRDNSVNSAPIAFTDTTADDTLSVNEQLDVASFPSQITSGATLVAPWKGALVLAGTEDGSMYFSRPLTPGLGPAFNGALTQAPWEGGPVTAMADLDGTFVTFHSSGISRIGGEPPADNGSSTLSAPESIRSDIGCTDVRGVVSTPDGIEFPSATGLALLSRDFSTAPNGRGIEDSFPPGTSYVGAVLLPGQNLVRFVRSASSFQIANRDYYHSHQYQTPVWSLDDLYDPAASADATLSACCVWRGVFTWISSAGRVYREDSSTYLDTGGGNTSWVTAAVSTPFEKATGVQGRHRVRRVVVGGDYSTPHGVAITLQSDLGSQTKTFSAAEVAAAVRNWQFRVHSVNQKVQWMRITVEDVDPVTSRGTGLGASVRCVSVEVGAKPGVTKLPASSSK